MSSNLGNLEAFRVLEIKLLNGEWTMVDPDDFLGPATIQVDTGLISQVTVTVRDQGVPADPEIGGIEYPRLDPNNLGTMRCRLSFGYSRQPNTTKKMYEGFLKEMRPQFPSNKAPRAELVFQCAGWEFTRVKRTVTYPHVDKKVAEEVKELRQDTDYEIDPEDRSWAARSNVEETISLEEILRTIIESYGYEVDIKLPDETVKFTAESALHQREQTDFQFIKELGSRENYDFDIHADVVKEQVTGSDRTTSVFKWFILPTSEVTETQQRNDLEFWFHREGGEKVMEYDPSTKSKFVILSEPDITVNSNWAFQPQLEKVTDEEGNTEYKQVSSGPTTVYDIDRSKLKTDAADIYAVDYMTGNAGWEEARKFFIKNTVGHHGSNNKGENRSIFQGVELSFETMGNPLAEVGMVYPIKGLGRFYSRNMRLMSMTHTVDSEWHTQYNWKMV